ncbi:MAG: SDR family oxidoreductase [Candidatus Methylomirabilales bacterium]
MSEPKLKSKDTGGKLAGRVALVAGATRGAGRGIAVELGVAGAAVVVTGRSGRGRGRSPMDRPETIEETAELIGVAGGKGIPCVVDHSDAGQVAELIGRIRRDHGRLDVLVNDIWGGDALTSWGTSFWLHSLDHGLQLLHNAVDTHLITSWHAIPLMIESGGNLIVEVTDGTTDAYRGNLFYDVAKHTVNRLALALAAELPAQGITALAVSPGFLRSEAMLDHFGVSEETWREAVAQDAHFAASETPRYIGRAVAALAADPDAHRFNGRVLGTWDLSDIYGFSDVDGSRPHWGSYYERFVGPSLEG